MTFTIDEVACYDWYIIKWC